MILHLRRNHLNEIHQRALCPICQKKPIAINCIQKGKTYYRKMCDACMRAGKKLIPRPASWIVSGYKKLNHCESCGFVAIQPYLQLNVFHVDGNLKNTNWTNLKTICLNCTPLVYKSKLPWKPSAPVT